MATTFSRWPGLDGCVYFSCAVNLLECNSSGATFRRVSHPPPNGRGVLTLPAALLPEDERAAREARALANIEARLAAGLVDPEAADEEILELALARFEYLPDEVLGELREVGRELNREPEMVESRALAPRPETWGRQ